MCIGHTNDAPIEAGTDMIAESLALLQLGQIKKHGSNDCFGGKGTVYN
jgi:hypothetical protein